MSFQKSISQTLILGQILGLMPLHGITKSSQDLQFKWKSFRCFFFIVIFFQAAFVIFVTIFWIIRNKKFSSGNLIVMVIFMANFITVILFFRLRTMWPKLIRSCETFEEAFKIVDNENFRKSNLRMIVIASSAISEFVWPFCPLWKEFKLILFYLCSWTHPSNTYQLFPFSEVWRNICDKSFLHQQLPRIVFHLQLHTVWRIFGKGHELHHYPYLGLSRPFCH